MIPKGGLTTWSNGIKVRYYHLHIDNKRPHAPATRVKVMIRQYYIHGPHGKFIRDANHIPVQLQYEFPNLPNHDPRPTIGSATLCDIGFVTERDDFRFATYFVPHTFKSLLKPNERVRILLRAEGENAVSNEVLLEIAWSGVWKEDTLQMAKNFVITDIFRSAARAVVGNGANRRFKFDKRRQLFICAHNEMLSVAAIMVSTVGSIGGYKQPFPIPKTRSVFHLLAQ